MESSFIKSSIFPIQRCNAETILLPLRGLVPFHYLSHSKWLFLSLNSSVYFPKTKSKVVVLFLQLLLKFHLCTNDLDLEARFAELSAEFHKAAEDKMKVGKNMLQDY